MAYKELQLDSETPEKVKHFINNNIEVLCFSDIHNMLRLPIADCKLTAGCNFAITHVLMAVIGGASTTLYKQNGKVGERFIGILKDYYPWKLEPESILQKEYYPWQLEPRGILPEDDPAYVIYKVFRNPLTHDLGLDVKNKSKGKVSITRLRRPTGIDKRDEGLTESQIETLETSQTWPSMIPSATITDTGQKTVLLVEGLYWGVRRMIEELSKAPERMKAAEEFLAAEDGVTYSSGRPPNDKWVRQL